MHNISSTLASLAVALMMNGLIIGGVAYLFDAALHQAPSALAGAAIAPPAAALV